MMQVLIVDDDRAILDTLSELLALYGIEASKTATGEEAADRANSERFDAIILDVNMKGSDGLATYNRLREAGITATVIALTGWPSSPAANQLREKHGVTVLTKPPEIEQLVAIIHGADTSGARNGT